MQRLIDVSIFTHVSVRFGGGHQGIGTSPA